MKQAIADRASTLVVVIGCAALLTTLAQPVAHSQGIAALATVKPSDPARDIVTLRQQVVALEKRVAELEKEELEKFKGDDVADDAAAKKLEQRLAKLEGAQQTAKNDGKAGTKPDAAGDDEPMTVRAPFVVLDKGGRTIFRVHTTADGRAVAVVGNQLGAAAVIGTDTEGNMALRLFDAQRQPSVWLAAKDEGGYLRLKNKANNEAVTLSVDRGGAGLVKVHSAAGRALTALSSNASGGLVLVADGQSGQNTVTLQTSAEGGIASVYAPQAGSSPRAMMVADGASGSISVLNGTGIAVAALETGDGGAGRLVTTDGSGTVMVEAGTLTKGIGIVRTGPGGFGPAGVTGGVMPASSIQGRK